MPKYLYCRDIELSKSLALTHKVLNKISSSNGETWVFEYNPSLFSLDFDNKKIKEKCHLSDKLIMTFTN